MHYLEDDLDLLDGVTEELKAQCFEMRELDSRVEKALMEVREESRDFFNAIKSLDDEERSLRRQKIKEEYQKIREMSEEKLAIAEFLELMLEKYQERIAKDLNEFKVELEADTPNITETIEKELCESIKNACNQKRVKSLIVSLPSSAASNNIESEISAEDSGFEDVKPSTSGNYRLNGNKYLGQIDHLTKASSYDSSHPLPSPSRHQKRPGSISIGRSLTTDGSFSTEMSDFLPPPIKKKSNHSYASSSPLDNYLGNNIVNEKGERKHSRLVSTKPSLHSRQLNSNGPLLHRDKSSGSYKPNKMLSYSNSLSTSQHWSPLSSNYLNSNNGISPGSSSVLASNAASPTSNPGSPALIGRISSHQYSYQQSAQSTSNNIVTGNNVGASTSAMPAFAGGQESQYGRPVKLTSRVQQMLKDRQTHRLGRLPSSIHGVNAVGHTSSASVRYSNSPSFSEDENREGGFRQRSGSNSQRRRRVIVEEDEVDEEVSNLPFDDEEDQNLDAADDELGDEYFDNENQDEIDEENGEDEDQDNNVWCLCQQKSEGDMVACDNKSCPYEWFHYECVGITAPPRGKWFCPVCVKNVRRSRSISMESH